MKYSIVKEERGFQPFAATIFFESEQDVSALHEFMCYTNDHIDSADIAVADYIGNGLTKAESVCNVMSELSELGYRAMEEVSG